MEPAPAPLGRELLEHREWLRALAGALVGAQEADDLVQETWLAALRSGHDPLEARPWLASILRNLARGLRRARGRSREREEQVARVEALPSTAELIERLDAEQRLARELASLREPFRTTLLLRFHEGLTAEEIARRQGLPAGTVRWRVKRGLEDLRARLERALGGSEAFALAFVPLARGGTPAAVAAVGGGPLLFSALAKVLVGAATLGLALLVLARPWAPRGSPRAGESTPPSLQLSSPGPEAGVEGPSSERSRAEAARSEAAAASSMQVACVLRVLAPDGSPHALRRVWMRSPAGDAPAGSRTDARGALELAPDGSRVELAIERPAAFPHRAELQCTPGEHELRLSDGLELAGTILVRDGTSAADVPLRLVPAGADGSPFAPDDPFGAPRAELRTGSRGDFAFQGLPAGRFDLVFPEGYARVGSSEPPDAFTPLVLRDLEPTRGLVIEVERLPRLRGRLVEADGRTPTAGLVQGRFTWTDGTHTDCAAPAGEDGLFELVPSGPWRALWLDLAGAPGQRGRTSVSFERAEVGSEGLLGDLRLAAGRTLTLDVRRPDGSPVAGARTDIDSPASDADGRLELVDVTAESVRVVARGHREQRVELPAAPGVVTVVLEPAPELLLELRDRAGRPVSNLLIELRAARWGFDGERPSLLLSAQREGRLVTWTREPFVAKARPDGAGRLRLDSLAAGLAFHLRVVAGNGTIVHEAEIEPLGAAERRELVLTLTQELRPLRVRVLDERHAPLAGARVTFSTRSGGSTHFDHESTDAEGRFACTRLDLPLALEAHAEGYLPLRRELAGIPTDEVELVLQRGLEVAVLVTDARGQPVARGSLHVSGCELEPREVAPGRFTVPGLAPGAHDFVLRLGGGEFVRRHEAHVPELALWVPEMGALEVGWEVEASRASGRFVTLELRAGSGAPAQLEQPYFDTPAGSHRFETVLPGTYELRLTTATGEEEVLLARGQAVVTAGGSAKVRLAPAD
ncbi:MAG TPA: sigma-70 family RNA polymerase sigma factor [Planctomycetota bacterium]